MANRWIGVTLVGFCLAAAQAWGQGPPAPMSCGPSGPGPGFAGPMAPPYAPEGPPCDLSLPANSPNAFICDQPCPPRVPVVYGDFQYLSWWFKRPQLPGPLLTTSYDMTTTATTGTIGATNTVPLVTDGTLKYRNPFSGGRVTLGLFLDDQQHGAFEATGFVVGQRTAKVMAFSQQTTGIPAVTSPYTDFQTGAAAAFPFASPGTLVGGAQVASTARLWGAEGNFVCNYPDCCIACIPFPVSFLAGFRYLNLDETLAVSSVSQGLGTGTVSFPAIGGGANLALPNPAYVQGIDSFHTRNQFYGGQVGARLGWSFGGFFIGGQAKIAIGGVNEQVNISGSTTLNAPGGLPVTVPGHLYAVGSNIGTYNRNTFAYAPEGEARFGYRFTSWMLGYVGYNFLYMSRVARPGPQMDTVIDIRQSPASPSFVPGFVGTNPAPPIPTINQSTFWAQGINVGLEFTY